MKKRQCIVALVVVAVILLIGIIVFLMVRKTGNSGTSDGINKGVLEADSIFNFDEIDYVEVWKNDGRAKITGSGIRDVQDVLKKYTYWEMPMDTPPTGFVYDLELVYKDGSSIDYSVIDDIRTETKRYGCSNIQELTQKLDELFKANR